MGMYSNSFVGYVAKKCDVFSKSNMVNYQHYLTQMFPSDRTVMFVPTITLPPTWLKASMISRVKVKQLSKQVTNNLSPYIAIISKKELTEEYEKIMGPKTLEKQEQYTKSLETHTESAKCDYEKGASYDTGEKINAEKDFFMTQFLEDDEVILLYMTSLYQWNVIIKNEPMKFEKKLFSLTGRGNSSQASTNQQNIPPCQNQTRIHLPFNVSAMIYPKAAVGSFDSVPGYGVLKQNDAILRFLITAERMCVSLDETFHKLSDKDFARVLYQSNLCDQKSNYDSPVLNDIGDKNLNVLGVLIKSRLENVLHTKIYDPSPYLKATPAGRENDDLESLQSLQNEGMSTAGMIAGFYLTPLTAANSKPPRKIEAPLRKGKQMQLITPANKYVLVNDQVSGEFPSVFRHHECCGNLEMAGYIAMLGGLVTDTKMNRLFACDKCKERGITECFQVLIQVMGSPTMTKYDQDKAGNAIRNKHVGLVLMSDMNNAGSFAGRTKMHIQEKNPPTEVFLASLMYDRLVNVYRKTAEQNNLFDGIKEGMSFPQLVGTFIKNVRSLDEYIAYQKHSISVPSIEELDGCKLEAEWIKTEKPELNHIGLLRVATDRSQTMRRIIGAVAKFDVNVSSEPIFQVLSTKESSKYFTIVVSPFGSNHDDPMTSGISEYEFVPQLKSEFRPGEQDNDVDMGGGSDVVKTNRKEEEVEAWVTVANPVQKDVAVSISREKYEKVTEKHRYLMTIVTKNEEAAYPSMSKVKKNGMSSMFEKPTGIQYLNSKILSLLTEHAESLGIKKPSILAQPQYLSSIEQVIGLSESLQSLKYVNESIDISSMKRLLDLLSVSGTMSRLGFVPDNNRRVSYVHYNKMTGNVGKNHDDCFVLNEDVGLAPEEIIYSKGLLVFGRVQPQCYQIPNSKDSYCHSLSLKDYDHTLDAFWYKMGAKYSRFKETLHVNGCFFAKTLTKAVKYEKEPQVKNEIAEFLQKVRSKLSVVERVKRLCKTADFNFGAHCRKRLGIKEENMDIVESAVNDSDMLKMLISNFNMEDLIQGDAMIAGLKCAIRGDVAGDDNYEDALIMAVEEDQNSVNEEEEEEFVMDFSSIFTEMVPSGNKLVMAENNEGSGDLELQNDNYSDGETEPVQPPVKKIKLVNAMQ